LRRGSSLEGTVRSFRFLIGEEFRQVHGTSPVFSNRVIGERSAAFRALRVLT